MAVYCKVCGKPPKWSNLTAGVGGFPWTCDDCKAARNQSANMGAAPSGAGNASLGFLVVGFCVLGLFAYSLAWVWSKVAYWDNVYLVQGTQTFKDEQFTKPGDVVRFQAGDFAKHSVPVYRIKDCSEFALELRLPLRKIATSKKERMRADGKAEVVAYELPSVEYGGGYLHPGTVVLEKSAVLQTLVQQAQGAYYAAHPDEFTGVSFIKPPQCAKPE